MSAVRLGTVVCVVFTGIYIIRHLTLRHAGAPSQTNFTGNSRPVPDLLTLFTTARDLEDRLLTLTLDNWSRLADDIKPYMFHSRGRTVSTSWSTIPVPRANRYAVPYLKNMFRKVMDMTDSLFYGYANSDIWFEAVSLRKTLIGLKPHVSRLRPVLLVGRRTTVDYHDNMTTPDDVRSLASRGTLDRADAEDYFLVTRDFPWRILPELVVGRKGYDNYLVAASIRNNVTVVDCTDTILAVHLRRPQSVSRRATADHLFNKYRLVNKFHYMQAMTISAPYRTSVTSRGDIVFKKRRFKNII